MPNESHGNDQAVEPPANLDIVVAHYNEDLSWLKPVADLATIYSKGDYSGSFPKQFHLPNIGRESHTYLYHIVNNYDNLADVTLFIQGQVEDHLALSPELFVAYSKHGLKQFDAWSGIVHVKKWKEDQDSGAMRSATESPATFWMNVFGTQHPKEITFSWAALFAVRKEAVKQRPKEFYERLLRMFEEINHENPEEGHYMERFWLNIFVPGREVVPVMPGITNV
jgi:hypothetical protein